MAALTASEVLFCSWPSTDDDSWKHLPAFYCTYEEYALQECRNTSTGRLAMKRFDELLLDIVVGGSLIYLGIKILTERGLFRASDSLRNPAIHQKLHALSLCPCCLAEDLKRNKKSRVGPTLLFLLQHSLAAIAQRRRRTPGY